MMGCSEDEGIFYPSESPDMCYYITGLKSYTPDCEGVVLSLVYSEGFENEDYDPVFILCVSKETAEDNAFSLVKNMRCKSIQINTLKHHYKPCY